jgi:hypothetical protein
VTPQEEQLLNSLVERVNQTKLQEKDPDADALLNSKLGTNPDAHYILAQTVLVQNIALEHAKAQITQLQQKLQEAQQAQQALQAQQAQQPAHTTSFLGSLLGRHDPAPPPPPPTQPAYTPVAQPAYVPPPPLPVPVYVPVQYDPPLYGPMGYGQPSFLGSALQTAAGVVAGELAFEGIEAAIHGIAGRPYYGWDGPGMGMGGFGMNPGMGMMGGGFERPVEETVINNNYYEQPGGQEHIERGSVDQSGFNQGATEPQFHESAAQADLGGAQFSDASYKTTGDDQASIDNAGTQDAAADDSANYVDPALDSGGFDNSSDLDSGGGGFDGGGGFGGDSSGGDLL